MSNQYWQVIAYRSTLKPSIVGSSEDLKTVVDMAYNVIKRNDETLIGITIKRAATAKTGKGARL
ncbi:hypothetical protein SAMN05660772_00993 [Pasteurella testudinis DSM 23072]|uniref:Uncharacterized protein n=1 Tax=Pasteurella testudinis DSM 23072 TaxID=1122938 RepID=A0A1W1V2J7_9PAST|nr:hypothetical protein [Pasteurella testudinis]SMB87520.1 hypothetical protein SAMN05660772_00993 [Pasteurella testudinis DSM 23072]SUB50526.1 Uncharacterised protein [Pasteurella testudinis]